jgi:hypothetical protein
MKEVWSRDKSDIFKELEKLTVVRSAISLQDEKGHFATSRLHAMVHRGNDTHLIFQRPRNLSNVGRVQKIVFKLMDRPYTYFTVKMEKANDRLMSCGIPQELFFLQRRLFPRYRVKNRGAAAFFLNRRARVCHMNLEDLSLGGAKLRGIPRYDMRVAEILGPATFTLVSDQDLVAREITLNQPTVVRSIAKEGTFWDVGLRFYISRSERALLANLLSDPFAGIIFR